MNIFSKYIKRLLLIALFVATTTVSHAFNLQNKITLTTNQNGLRGVCRTIQPIIEFFSETEGPYKHSPLVVLYSPTPDLNRLMPPPILYLGEGSLYTSQEDLKWTIGQCDPTNLPT